MLDHQLHWKEGRKEERKGKKGRKKGKRKKERKKEKEKERKEERKKISFGEDEEKLELWCTVGGNAKSVAAMENSIVVSK